MYVKQKVNGDTVTAPIPVNPPASNPETSKIWLAGGAGIRPEPSK